MRAETGGGKKSGGNCLRDIYRGGEYGGGGGDSRYSMVFRLPSYLTIKNAQNHTHQKMER